MMRQPFFQLIEVPIIQLHEKRLIDLERYLQENPLGIGFRRFKEKSQIVMDFPDQLDPDQ